MGCGHETRPQRLGKHQLFRQTVDSGIVVRFRADKKVRIRDLWQMAQNLRQPLRGKLACSTSARGVVDETLLATEEQHETSLARSGVRDQSEPEAQVKTADSFAYASGSDGGVTRASRIRRGSSRFALALPRQPVR